MIKLSIKSIYREPFTVFLSLLTESRDLSKTIQRSRVTERSSSLGLTLRGRPRLRQRRRLRGRLLSVSTHLFTYLYPLRSSFRERCPQGAHSLAIQLSKNKMFLLRPRRYFRSFIVLADDARRNFNMFLRTTGEDTSREHQKYTPIGHIVSSKIS